jgi:hypothetical protein
VRHARQAPEQCAQAMRVSKITQAKHGSRLDYVDHID